MKKKQDEIEARNNAESLVNNSEKTLNELGDKVSSEEKAKVEEEIANVRKALEGTDTEAIKSAKEELEKKFYEVSSKIYSQANPQGAPNQNPQGAQGDDGVYDADYTVVDDDNKTN